MNLVYITTDDKQNTHHMLLYAVFIFSVFLDLTLFS